jgi:pimeloyl-ACP methyl ester carboxylesterase
MCERRLVPTEECLTLEEKIAPVAGDWVQRMIDAPGRSGHLHSDDQLTRYLEWGDSSNARVLMLLHGFRGHTHWWDFIAPWFARDYRVIAIDFAGMGDSSSRLKYSRATVLPHWRSGSARPYAAAADPP